MAATGVRRDKAALSSGCKPHPANSLPPEAIGAVMEQSWRCYGASGEPGRHRRKQSNDKGFPMANNFDTRKSCDPFDQSSTLVAVIELSKDSWLAGGIVPGLERSPAKKIERDRKGRKRRLLALLLRWRDEAIKSGQEIKRIAVALEFRAGRLLAGALAEGPRHRSLCHPRRQYRRVA